MPSSLLLTPATALLWALGFAGVYVDVAGAGLGQGVAGRAADLRGEYGLGLGAGLLGSLVWRTSAGRAAAAAYVLTADIPALALRLANPAPASSLGGAPVHLLCAGFCGFGVVLAQGPARAPLTSAPTLLAGYTGVLLLGLVGNLTQSAGRAGWAGDWIEVIPLGGLSAALGLAHLGSRGTRAVPLVTYLGGLQLSRAALLASAHHLSPPSGAGAGLELGGAHAGGSAVVWEGWALAVGSGCALMRPRLSLPGGARLVTYVGGGPRPPRLLQLHASAGTWVAVALLPAWALCLGPTYDATLAAPGTGGGLWAGAGVAGYRRSRRLPSDARSLTLTAAHLSLTTWRYPATRPGGITLS